MLYLTAMLWEQTLYFYTQIVCSSLLKADLQVSALAICVVPYSSGEVMEDLLHRMMVEIVYA